MHHRRVARRVTVVLLAGVLPLQVMAAEEGVSVGVGLEYSTGDYGSVSDTHLWSVPFSAQFAMQGLTVRASLPWLRLTGPGDVIPGLGQVGSVKGRRKGLPGTPSTSTRSSESGLGDLTGSVTYELPVGGKDEMSFDVTGRIKVPTADEDKGLGSGEFDYAIEAGVAQAMGPQLRLRAMLGYAVLGDNAATALDNVFYGSVGALFRFDERTSADLTLALGQATSSFAGRRADLTAAIHYDLGGGLRLKGYALKGFADGSPDYGAGVMLEVRF